MSKEIYFLSFYTDGYGAADLTHVAKKVEEKLSKYFTKMFIYNKESLKQLPNSENICNIFEEPTDMTYFPYAHKMGYYDWKAFLVDYTINRIPENSILLS